MFVDQQVDVQQFVCCCQNDFADAVVIQIVAAFAQETVRCEHRYRILEHRIRLTAINVITGRIPFKPIIQVPLYQNFGCLSILPMKLKRTVFDTE